MTVIDTRSTRADELCLTNDDIRSRTVAIVREGEKHRQAYLDQEFAKLIEELRRKGETTQDIVEAIHRAVDRG